MFTKLNTLAGLSLGLLLFIALACDSGKGNKDNTNDTTSSTNNSELIANPNTTVNNATAPDPTCVAANFASWFEGGSVTAGGMVSAANSLDAFNQSCDFYQWSWRMFLWLVSPEKQAGKYVFNSDMFFDMLPDGSLVQDNTKLARTSKLSSVEQAGFGKFAFMANKGELAPDGSILYYAIHVNDVYAYFASGQKNGGPLKNMTEFPTTEGAKDSIVSYAKTKYGADIKDGNALAMELKTSWIKIDTSSADAKNYITMTADVPKYEKVSDTELKWDGKTYETATVALVGFHVVGSTKDHPEMIWATFEHRNNTPDVNYQYINANKDTTTQTTFNPDGTLAGDAKNTKWLFFASNANMNSANEPQMSVGDNNTIKAETGKSIIGPNNVVRTHPWGQNGTADIVNNTAILSINNSIQGLLAPTDVRRNYLMVGATWTSNGVPGLPNGQEAIIKGSQTLANSSMETFFQKDDCFTCHQGGKLTGLSHIYGNIKPIVWTEKK